MLNRQVEAMDFHPTRASRDQAMGYSEKRPAKRKFMMQPVPEDKVRKPSPAALKNQSVREAEREHTKLLRREFRKQMTLQNRAINDAIRKAEQAQRKADRQARLELEKEVREERARQRRDQMMGIKPELYTVAPIPLKPDVYLDDGRIKIWIDAKTEVTLKAGSDPDIARQKFINRDQKITF